METHVTAKRLAPLSLCTLPVPLSIDKSLSLFLILSPEYSLSTSYPYTLFALRNSTSGSHCVVHIRSEVWENYYLGPYESQ